MNKKMFGGLNLSSIFVHDQDTKLKYLIDSGQLSVNSLCNPAPNTWTLLMYSVHTGSKRCTILLLEYGCKVNYVDEAGQSALHKCGFYPHCVEMLLENGAETEAKANEGFTPLASYLWRNYRPESVQFLLLHGAKVENVKNTNTLFIPTWVKEFDATLKKRVQECRKALLALLWCCKCSNLRRQRPLWGGAAFGGRAGFAAVRGVIFQMATQVWRLKGGEGCGPRAGGASGAQGWGIDSQRESIKL